MPASVGLADAGLRDHAVNSARLASCCEVFGVVFCEEHRHHDIHQHEQGHSDQREGVRACLALLLDGIEPGSAVVRAARAARPKLILKPSLGLDLP